MYGHLHEIRANRQSFICRSNIVEGDSWGGVLAILEFKGRPLPVHSAEVKAFYYLPLLQAC